MKKQKPLVSIIMGSDSDLPVMQEAAAFLDEQGISNEVTVVSAHRTPDVLYAHSVAAQKRGVKVIIAGAGGAAHLPGMVASMTALPVIGVPIKTKSMDGLDSLLSIAQMPPGVPVASVAVNGAKNAGILAAQIIGTADAQVLKKIARFKQSMNTTVKQKAAKLEKVGYKKYLSEK